MSQIENKRVIDLLNRIFSNPSWPGIIRYTHYSFLVYGYNRIPIGCASRQPNPKPTPSSPAK